MHRKTSNQILQIIFRRDNHSFLHGISLQESLGEMGFFRRIPFHLKGGHLPVRFLNQINFLLLVGAPKISVAEMLPVMVALHPLYDEKVLP